MLHIIKEILEDVLKARMRNHLFLFNFVIKRRKSDFFIEYISRGYIYITSEEGGKGGTNKLFRVIK